MIRVLASIARAAAALLAAPVVLVWDGLRWIRQAVAPPPTAAQEIAAEIEADRRPYVPCLPDIYTQDDPGSVARAWCAWHARLPHAPAEEPPVRDDVLARWLHSLSLRERKAVARAHIGLINGHICGETRLPNVPAYSVPPQGDMDVAAAARDRAREIAAKDREMAMAMADWLENGCDERVNPFARFQTA